MDETEIRERLSASHGHVAVLFRGDKRAFVEIGGRIQKRRQRRKLQVAVAAGMLGIAIVSGSLFLQQLGGDTEMLASDDNSSQSSQASNPGATGGDDEGGAYVRPQVDPVVPGVRSKPSPLADSALGVVVPTGDNGLARLTAPSDVLDGYTLTMLPAVEIEIAGDPPKTVLTWSKESKAQILAEVCRTVNQSLPEECNPSQVDTLKDGGREFTQYRLGDSIAAWVGILVTDEWTVLATEGSRSVQKTTLNALRITTDRHGYPAVAGDGVRSVNALVVRADHPEKMDFSLYIKISGDESTITLDPSDSDSSDVPPEEFERLEGSFSIEPITID